MKPTKTNFARLQSGIQAIFTIKTAQPELTFRKQKQVAFTKSNETVDAAKKSLS